jgi:hypothetical protein
MYAVNICFTFTDKLNQILNELNKNINSIIHFDNTHLPHITLLQFYTSKKNINNIKYILNHINYDFTQFIINKLKIIKYKELNIYTLNFENNDIISFQNKIINIFKKFIEIPNFNNNNFIENITYEPLHDIVKNYYKNIYLPHITFAISKNEYEIDFNEIIINNSDIKLELLFIGEYGTAIPIHNVNTL